MSRAGTSEAFLQHLAETSQSAHLVLMFDSITVRGHVSAAGAKGQQKSDTRPLNGGFSCKILLKTDFRGRPISFHLTGGKVSDSTQLVTSLEIGLDAKPRSAMTHRGYDSKVHYTACRKRGFSIVMPQGSNAKYWPKMSTKTPYATRDRIEQAMGKLKRSKQVALRWEKPAENFSAIIAFAYLLIRRNRPESLACDNVFTKYVIASENPLAWIWLWARSTSTH